jgi:hypothetical protein
VSGRLPPIAIAGFLPQQIFYTGGRSQTQTCGPGVHVRVKLIFLAASLALIVAALFFGAGVCGDAAKEHSSSTGQRSQEAAEELEGVNDPTSGGVGNTNENLEQMKRDMQEQADERANDIDKRIDRSASPND